VILVFHEIPNMGRIDYGPLPYEFYNNVIEGVVKRLRKVQNNLVMFAHCLIIFILPNSLEEVKNPFFTHKYIHMC